MYINIYVKHLLFLSCLNETWIFPIDLRKNIKFLKKNPSSGSRDFPCTRKDGHPKLTVAFLNFVTASKNNNKFSIVLFVFGATAPQWAKASSFARFLDHTQRRTTVGRTAPDAWLALHRNLYLTTHNSHNRQTFIPLVGFEITITYSNVQIKLAMHKCRFRLQLGHYRDLPFWHVI